MISTLTAKRSSNIARVDYDPPSLTLTLHFKSGGIYRYTSVSPTDYRQFITSKSLGKAFNQMFWGKPKQHPAIKLAPTSGH
jgi:KTSC domain